MPLHAGVHDHGAHGAEDLTAKLPASELIAFHPETQRGATRHRAPPAWMPFVDGRLLLLPPPPATVAAKPIALLCDVGHHVMTYTMDIRVLARLINPATLTTAGAPSCFGVFKRLSDNEIVCVPVKANATHRDFVGSGFRLLYTTAGTYHCGWDAQQEWLRLPVRNGTKEVTIDAPSSNAKVESANVVYRSALVASQERARVLVLTACHLGKQVQAVLFQLLNSLSDADNHIGESAEQLTLERSGAHLYNTAPWLQAVSAQADAMGNAALSTAARRLLQPAAQPAAQPCSALAHEREHDYADAARLIAGPDTGDTHRSLVQHLERSHAFAHTLELGVGPSDTRCPSPSLSVALQAQPEAG